MRLNAKHCNTLQHTATHCNTLQHTATHCNTLQRTVTHLTSARGYKVQPHKFLIKRRVCSFVLSNLTVLSWFSIPKRTYKSRLYRPTWAQAPIHPSTTQYFGFWLLVCYTATPLAMQILVQQERIQVVRSNKLAWKRLTESESKSTFAIDFGREEIRKHRYTQTKNRTKHTSTKAI